MRAAALVITLFLASSAFAQNPTCQKYAVIWKDHFGNLIPGFPAGADDAKFQQKLEKKYSVCYDAHAPILFLISTESDVYHGTRRETETHDSPVTGTVQDDNPSSRTYGQDVGTISGTVNTTTSTSVPYEVQYKHLYLQIIHDGPDGKAMTFQTISGETLYNTMYGMCIKNCHPTQKLIENAVKWVTSTKLRTLAALLGDVRH